MRAWLSSCHPALRLPRRAAASSPAPSPPKGRRCPAAARPSSAPPWPRRSPAAGCRVQGVGSRAEREGTGLPFLGRRTSRLANLLGGAAQGRRSPGAMRPGHPGARSRLLPCRAPWEGPGRAPSGWGATWPAPRGRADSLDRVPEQRQRPPKGSASFLGGSSPSSALFPPPAPAPFSSDCRGRFVPGTSLVARVSQLLEAARPVRHRLFAAHSSRHRKSGPAPGEGAAGKLESGRNRPRRGSGTTAQPGAPREAKVLLRHPLGSPPKTTWSRQKPGEHATIGWHKKSLSCEYSGLLSQRQEARATFPVTTAPSSGRCRPSTAVRSGPMCARGARGQRGEARVALGPRILTTVLQAASTGEWCIGDSGSAGVAG